MEKTTIFPSRFWSAVGVLALVLGVTPLAAQDRPAAHTVRRGDTLWDLAQHYLGDPLLWPQIYRLNTDVVEDPHWIYPGEVLRLVPGPDQPSAVPAAPSEPAAAVPPVPTEPVAAESVAVEPVVPAPPPPPPVAERRRGEAPVDGVPFWERKPPTQQLTLEALSTDTYRPLRPGEFFSSGFLTEHEPLPFGEVLGTVTPPQIRSSTRDNAVTLYTAIAVRAPAGGTYAVGDSLLIAFLEQGGPNFQPYGDVLVPTGLARITGQNGADYVATVVSIFGPIRRGQVVLPAERFHDPGNVRPVPTDASLTGRVIGGRELRELKHPQNVLFIDLGKDAGAQLGDIFEVRREPADRIGSAGTVDELMARGQVVHVRGRSATLLLTAVVSPDIPSGTPVRRVFKLPG